MALSVPNASCDDRDPAVSRCIALRCPDFPPKSLACAQDKAIAWLIVRLQIYLDALDWEIVQLEGLEIIHCSSPMAPCVPIWSSPKLSQLKSKNFENQEVTPSIWRSSSILKKNCPISLRDFQNIRRPPSSMLFQDEPLTRQE